MDTSDHVRVSPSKLNTDWGFPNMLGLILAIVAVIITIILFSIFRKNKVRKNGILIVGLSGSGKTLIFSRLIFDKYMLTCTSIKENTSDYIVGNNTYKVIEIPGHERLRTRYFDQFKSLAKGIVFLIDSVTVQKDIRDVAEFLYTCLVDSYVASYMPPVLILCNKQDEATAKGCSVVKLMLEKEMNLLRTTKMNQLESIGTATGNQFLGKKGQDFEFSHLLPMKIDFAESSALSSDNKMEFNIEELKNWIVNLN